MLTKRLGKTELDISALSYGASPLGGTFGPTDKAEGERAVHAAIDAGINYFDVAPLYGDTLAEERLGEALRGRRDQVIVATKFGHYAGQPAFDFGAKRARSSLEGSLRRLQTDHVDVFQAHDMDRADPRQIIEETLPAMRQLQQEGKCRFVGITGFYPDRLLKVAEQAEVDTILSFCHYDLIDQSLADELGPFCQAHDIGLLNASPLHMRLLTIKGPPVWNKLGGEPLRAAVSKAIALCETHGTSISDLAMQFALQCPYAATTLVGMSKERHLIRNTTQMGVQPDEELLNEVLGLFSKASYVNQRVG